MNGAGIILACCALPLLAPGALASDLEAADALFAKREDPKALEQAIDLYEKAGAHLEVLHGVFARLELHDDVKEEDAKLRWIERGLRAGEAALGTKDVPDDLAKLEKKDALALYLYAALYGRKIELSSYFSQAGMAKKFKRMCERAVALDGTVFHGGPHRMLGTFSAEAPGIMGGDWDVAFRELDRAVEIGPKFFENRVLRAEHAWVQKEDRARFRADLKQVIDAPDDVLPDCVPEQRRQKAAARKLLAREKELFD